MKLIALPFTLIGIVFTFLFMSGRTVEQDGIVLGRLEMDSSSRVGRWNRYCGNCGKRYSGAITSKKRPSKHKRKCGQCGTTNSFV